MKLINTLLCTVAMTTLAQLCYSAPAPPPEDSKKEVNKAWKGDGKAALEENVGSSSKQYETASKPYSYNDFRREVLLSPTPMGLTSLEKAGRSHLGRVQYDAYFDRFMNENQSLIPKFHKKKADHLTRRKQAIENTYYQDFEMAMDLDHLRKFKKQPELGMKSTFEKIPDHLKGKSQEFLDRYKAGHKDNDSEKVYEDHYMQALEDRRQSENSHPQMP